jgi:hypothetical protein
MVRVSNPFVAFLNRYTTASPDHEAAFDVVYDDVYGYLADVSPDVGDRLLVIEFLQGEEG